MAWIENIFESAADVCKRTFAKAHAATLADDDTRILRDFPHSLQFDGYSCGAQSTLVVLEYFGVEYFEDELKKMLGTTRRSGTDDGRIVEVLRDHGLRCSRFESASRARLQKAIHDRAPVIVDLDGDTHYGVVYGIGSDTVYLADSGTWMQVAWDWDDFRERWGGSGIAVRRPKRRRTT